MMHAAPMTSPRLRRVLALLRDGRPHTTRDIVRRARVMAVKARRFTLDEAKKQGVDEKAIKRLVQIGEAIPPELQAEIHGTPLADNQAQLLKLVALPPEDVAEVVRTMKESSIYKVEKARQLMAGQDEPAALPAEDVWQRKMATLWADAKISWRRRFLLSIDARFVEPEDGAE